MVSLTLTAADIAAAPPEVRRWIEAQLAATLGTIAAGRPDAPRGTSVHLKALGAPEVAGLFEAIRGDHLATVVFFELGRDVGSARPNGLHAFSVAELVRHAQLPDAAHLGACLGTINAAVKRLTGDVAATLFAIDPAGTLYLHETTHRAIRGLWQACLRSAGPPPGEAHASLHPHFPTASFAPPYGQAEEGAPKAG